MNTEQLKAACYFSLNMVGDNLKTVTVKGLLGKLNI